MAALRQPRHDARRARRPSAAFKTYVSAPVTPASLCRDTYAALQSSQTGTARALRLADRPRCQPQPTASRPEPDTAARRHGGAVHTERRPRRARVSPASRFRHLIAAISLALARMRSGLFLPLFDALADPAIVARLSAEAEEAGWARRLRLGQPALAGSRGRRGRPVDHAGGDRDGDRANPARPDGHATRPAPTGQGRPGNGDARPAQRRPADARRRPGQRPVRRASTRSLARSSTTGDAQAMLDESLEILTAAWSGEPVHHRGEHYTVDGMRFLPRPVQRPGVPVWVAGSTASQGPCAGRPGYEGFFPVDLEHPEQLAEIVADLAALRREAGRDPASLTTSSSHCRPAAIRRLTPPPAPPGGSSSSHGMRYRSTRCALRSATALPPPHDVPRGGAGASASVVGRPARSEFWRRAGRRATEQARRALGRPGLRGAVDRRRERPAALDRPCQSERGVPAVVCVACSASNALTTAGANCVPAVGVQFGEGFGA